MSTCDGVWSCKIQVPASRQQPSELTSPLPSSQFQFKWEVKRPIFFLSSYFKDYITIQFLEFKTTALIINFTSAVHVAFFLSRLVLSAVFLSVHSVTTTRSLFMQFILYLPSY